MALTWRRDQDGATIFTVSKVEEVQAIIVFLFREYQIENLRELDEHFPYGVMLEGPFDPKDFDVSKPEGHIFHFSHRATRR